MATAFNTSKPKGSVGTRTLPLKMRRRLRNSPPNGPFLMKREGGEKAQAAPAGAGVEGGVDWKAPTMKKKTKVAALEGEVDGKTPTMKKQKQVAALEGEANRKTPTMKKK